jgi:hypothetical protein
MQTTNDMLIFTRLVYGYGPVLGVGAGKQHGRGKAMPVARTAPPSTPPVRLLPPPTYRLKLKAPNRLSNDSLSDSAGAGVAKPSRACVPLGPNLPICLFARQIGGRRVRAPHTRRRQIWPGSSSSDKIHQENSANRQKQQHSSERRSASTGHQSCPRGNRPRCRDAPSTTVRTTMPSARLRRHSIKSCPRGSRPAIP